MANKRIKLTIVDSDGDENEIFPETDMYSVIGLEAELKNILNRLNKLDKKGTKL